MVAAYKQTGGPGGVEKLLKAATAAMGSKGDLSADIAMEAVVKSNARRPDLDAAGLQTVSSGIMSIQKGMPEVGTDTAMAMGQDLTIASRNPDEASMYQHVVPSIMTNLSMFKREPGDYRKMAAFQIGLGQRVDDPHGRKLGTAVTNYFKQALSENNIPLGSMTYGEFLKWRESDQGLAWRKKSMGGLWGASEADIAGADNELSPLHEMVQLQKQKLGIHSEAKYFTAVGEYQVGGKSRTQDQIDEAYRTIRDPNDPALLRDFEGSRDPSTRANTRLPDDRAHSRGQHGRKETRRPREWQGWRVPRKAAGLSATVGHERPRSNDGPLGLRLPRMGAELGRRRSTPKKTSGLPWSELAAVRSIVLGRHFKGSRRKKRAETPRPTDCSRSTVQADRLVETPAACSPRSCRP